MWKNRGLLENTAHFVCFHALVEYNFAMPVSATIEKLPEATAVITLQGNMTLGTSLKVADSQIHGTIADGVTRMVIDMTGVDYVDSAGLGMLVFAYGTLNEKNGSLRLCGVAPRVLSLLKMTKTDGFLPIDETRAESLSALAAS
jgi:anti-sigma B factor antagonist